MGRYALVKSRGIPLFFQAIAQGNPRKFDAAMALLTPPLAELVLLVLATVIISSAAWLLGGVSTLTVIALVLGSISLLGIIVYVFGGLRASGGIARGLPRSVSCPVLHAVENSSLREKSR